jgi:hypothetical protein
MDASKQSHDGTGLVTADTRRNQTSILSLVFSPLYSTKPTVIPTAQASSFRLQYFPYYVCDVPSTAVCCSESIECFSDMASKFVFQPLVTIPVAPDMSTINVRFMFHISCTSKHNVLYFIIVHVLAF